MVHELPEELDWWLGTIDFNLRDVVRNAVRVVVRDVVRGVVRGDLVASLSVAEGVKSIR